MLKDALRYVCLGKRGLPLRPALTEVAPYGDFVEPPGLQLVRLPLVLGSLALLEFFQDSHLPVSFYEGCPRALNFALGLGFLIGQSRGSAIEDRVIAVRVDQGPDISAAGGRQSAEQRQVVLLFGIECLSLAEQVLGGSERLHQAAAPLVALGEPQP